MQLKAPQTTHSTMIFMADRTNVPDVAAYKNSKILWKLVWVKSTVFAKEVYRCDY